MVFTRARFQWRSVSVGRPCARSLSPHTDVSLLGLESLIQHQTVLGRSAPLYLVDVEGCRLVRLRPTANAVLNAIAII